MRMKTSTLIALSLLLLARPGGLDSSKGATEAASSDLLADRYAPIIFHSSDESNLPTNVDWFLPKTSLRFYDDACTPDLHRELISAPTQARLLSWWHRGGCGSTDTVHSNGTRSNRKQRTFYLADVAERFRKGSQDSRDWTTYVHVYPNDIGG